MVSGNGVDNDNSISTLITVIEPKEYQAPYDYELIFDGFIAQSEFEFQRFDVNETVEQNIFENLPATSIILLPIGFLPDEIENYVLYAAKNDNPLIVLIQDPKSERYAPFDKLSDADYVKEVYRVFDQHPNVEFLILPSGSDIQHHTIFPELTQIIRKYLTAESRIVVDWVAQLTLLDATTNEQVDPLDSVYPDKNYILDLKLRGFTEEEQDKNWTKNREPFTGQLGVLAYGDAVYIAEPPAKLIEINETGGHVRFSIKFDAPAFRELPATRSIYAELLHNNFPLLTLDVKVSVTSDGWGLK